MILSGMKNMFKHPFYTRKGVVASESPLATTLGVKVLEMGGNSVDASIAASFALSITHPHLGGLEIISPSQ